MRYNRADNLHDNLRRRRMEDEELTFAQWLQRRRQTLRLTQGELGKLAACSAATIRKLEADERRPSPDVAKLLAVALHIPEAENSVFLRFARGDGGRSPPVAELGPPPPLPMEAPSNLPAPPNALIGRLQD